MTGHFADIFARACDRKGGEKKLRELLERPKPARSLLSTPDDRWLAEMTRCIFQAGFNWKVVDKMWDGFEAAFEGFDIHRMRILTTEDVDRLCGDTRIVRYGEKIRSVQHNAEFVFHLSKEYGSVGHFVADWPKEEFVDLLHLLKSKGSRLGGQTAQYFLRRMGVDGFILSRDGVSALISAGIIDGPPTSKAAMRDVQDAYNQWSRDTGFSLTEISKILACSYGPNGSSLQRPVHKAEGISL